MKKIIILANLLLFVATSNAQNVNFDEKYLEDGVYAFDESIQIHKQEVFTTYKSQFGLSERDEMTEDFTYVFPENNIIHTKYVQKYKGYPVEGAMMNVLGKEDVVERINGFVVKDLRIDDGNLINEEAALQNALRFVNAELYAWQVEEVDEEGNNTSANYYPKGKLVIAKTREAETPFINKYYKLCYRFSIRAVKPQQNLAVYIDAVTGAVFTSASETSHTQYPSIGTATTPYNGVRSINTSTCNWCTNHFLRDFSRNLYTRTSSDGVIKDGNNVWDSQSDKTPAGAHWAVGNAWDYFSIVHGKSGTKGTTNEIRIKINNASAAIGASYSFNDNIGGTFDLISLRPDDSSPGFSIAALDIMAHEYTHGMIFGSSKLSDGGFEANSLAEGFCDIFGEMTQERTLGTTNFIIGSDVGGCLPRNFVDPHADCGQPSTPNGKSASKYMEPGFWSATNGHANAGVLRKWFHLLAFGGSFNGITVGGVGTTKAANIAFLGFHSWLNSSVNYPTAANLIVAGVKYTYGNCSREHHATHNAFKAVGLNTAAPVCLPCCHDKVMNQGTTVDVINKEPIKSVSEDKKNIGIKYFKAEDVLIFPNPASSNVSIILPTKNESTTIEMIDMQGRILKTIQTNESILELDIFDFVSGMYWVKISTGDKKIIKKLNIIK